MLISIWSDKFIEDEKQRPPIIFHGGLNMIEGGAKAENSIGKSTVLYIIDFVFAGKDFLSTDTITLPQAVGHHTIYFTLKFGEDYYYLSRDTLRHGFISIYADDTYHEKSGEWTIDDYKLFLTEQYGLDFNDSTWRELIGRFVRIGEEPLANLTKPLLAASREPDEAGVKALQKLFGKYDELKALKDELAKASSEYSSLETIAKSGLSPYIKLRSKKERKQAAEELSETKTKLASLKVTADLSLYDKTREIKSQASKLRMSLRSLEEKRTALQSRLKLVEATLAGELRISSEELNAFYEFFPQANKEKLETVEYYHRSLIGILNDQIDEQAELYKKELGLVDEAIKQIKEKIYSLNESIELDDETYEKNGETVAKIKRLAEQISMFDKTQELKKLKKETGEALKERRPAILGSLASDLNAAFQRDNDFLYPDQDRLAPFFSFKESREGKLGYGFSSQGDNGAGAKSKNLILFDMAILELTALPFVIHDSTVIKQIAYLPVVKMLELYEKTAKLYDRCGDPKQVFFAFDASPAYGQEAVELSDELRVIHLDDGTKALYGYTWNTKKNKKNSEKTQ